MFKIKYKKGIKVAIINLENLNKRVSKSLIHTGNLKIEHFIDIYFGKLIGCRIRGSNQFIKLRSIIGGIGFEFTVNSNNPVILDFFDAKTERKK